MNSDHGATLINFQYFFHQDADTAVVSKPFCAQIDARLFSTTGNKCTADALVDLYTQMAAMEDTPMKRQFLKRVIHPDLTHLRIVNTNYKTRSANTEESHRPIIIFFGHYT